MVGLQYEDYDGKFKGNNVNCAVCLASSRSLTLMIPARIECPSGWTREYYGYLVAERRGHPSKSNFACLHKDLKAIYMANIHGPTMMHVEAECKGARHCPPYEQGKELACVVCTK